MTIREDMEPVDIGVSSATLANIALKAKAFDVQVASVDPGEASNGTDDAMIDALEDESDNPAAQDLRAAIASLDVDQRAALVALVWVGRGDFDADEWDDALALARERSSSGPASRYLMGIPLLGDYLEEGAAALGISLTDDETEAMSTPDIETSLDSSVDRSGAGREDRRG